MREPEDGVQQRGDQDLPGRDRQNLSDQKVLHLVHSVRRVLEHDEGRGHRHRVEDRDQRLGVHPAAPHQGEQRRRPQRERRGDRELAERVVLQPDDHADRGAESRSLREREVDEQHAAPDDVEAEVDVDSRQHQAAHERPAHEGIGPGFDEPVDQEPSAPPRISTIRSQ